jgi:hypothetical protein
MVHLTPDGGFALSILGPVAATFNGMNLSVVTEYPFGDALDISVAGALAGTPLLVRVPGWASKASFALNGAAVALSVLSQRHLRYWIAQFRSPWDAVPIVVGGPTGDCGHEPACTRTYCPTRDCGYVCTPAFSAVFAFLGGLCYVYTFGRFVAGTTGTFQQNYRTAGGWLTLVACGLLAAGWAFTLWSQWVACPVEHVWFCDTHLELAHGELDVEERALESTPHVEPRQGLPQLVVTLRLAAHALWVRVFAPTLAAAYRPVMRAGSAARIAATIPPGKSLPGPFDPARGPPKWLVAHEKRVAAEAEVERLRREKAAAFASPFRSLRRSFIVKPSLIGRGLEGGLPERLAAARAVQEAAAEELRREQEAERASRWVLGSPQHSRIVSSRSGIYAEPGASAPHLVPALVLPAPVPEGLEAALSADEYLGDADRARAVGARRGESMYADDLGGGIERPAPTRAW